MLGKLTRLKTGCEVNKMLNEKLVKVVQQWKKEGLEISPPSSEQQIIDCFQKIKKPISKDVLEFYIFTGGVSEGEMDSELFSFWTLKEIIEENLRLKSEVALFADFLIFSHCYGFKYENLMISSVYIDWLGQFPLTKVADSVEEFFDIYLKNPNDLLR